MEQIPFIEAADLLTRYKIKLAPSAVFVDREEAWVFVNEHRPAVMKIDVADVWHRTEAGGVFLNISERYDFDQAWDKMVRRGLRGVIIQPMRSGVELSLGAKRDPQFGPVIMFGLGGIMIELIKDAVFAIAPIDQAEARRMIRGIKNYQLLTGFRGKPVVDQEQLAQMIVNLGYLMAENPEIEEVDLNPVVAGERLIEAVDVKIWIQKHES